MITFPDPSDDGLAPLFEPPYYAVIFMSINSGVEPGAYGQTVQEMLGLAAKQDGYLGVETVSSDGGLGVTISYWRDEASIATWRAQGDHQTAQKAGRQQWYRAYRLRVAKVEREAKFP